MQILTTGYHFHLPKISNGTIQCWWGCNEMGASKHINGYDLCGGQVSNLDESLRDGHELTPGSSFWGDRGEHRDERVEQCFSDSVQKNGPIRCPGAKGLCGPINLGQGSSCSPFLKIPKAYWHAKDSKKTCSKEIL